MLSDVEVTYRMFGDERYGRGECEWHVFDGRVFMVKPGGDRVFLCTEFLLCRRNEQ